ncbi:hypothetical protein B0H10DRAFT_707547 [Mycena sp. CBHHK59/15]|nr:hypothetical protein B0H10DRAFT_707547 [Mycena sp. CBHHK59/15]
MLMSKAAQSHARDTQTTHQRRLTCPRYHGAFGHSMYAGGATIGSKISRRISVGKRWSVNRAPVCERTFRRSAHRSSRSSRCSSRSARRSRSQCFTASWTRISWSTARGSTSRTAGCTRFRSLGGVVCRTMALVAGRRGTGFASCWNACTGSAVGVTGLLKTGTTEANYRSTQGRRLGTDMVSGAQLALGGAIQYSAGVKKVDYGFLRSRKVTD